jgi:hypothetical protein
MTREVSFRYKGKRYSVDSDDIDRIFDESDLRENFSASESRSSAYLGLAYISMVSWQGGGVGNIPLFGKWSKVRGEHRSLLRPAFEVIAKHYGNK